MSYQKETEVVVVLVTAPDERAGLAIARTLVGEKLAACANMVPGLRSIYRWQGEVCDDPEVLLIIKTVTGKMGQLTEKVTSLHPYDTPEVICLPASGGLGEYLKWVSESVGE